MKYINIIVLLSVMLLCSVAVSADGISGQPYTFFEVPACYETIDVQVIPNLPTPYALLNCTKTNTNKFNWVCPCVEELQIETPVGTIGQFDIRVQYYISKPKPVDNINNTMLSTNQLYNDNIRRIDNIIDVKIISNEELKETVPFEITDAIFVLGGIFLGVSVIAIIMFALIYGLRNKFSRWFTMDSDLIEKRQEEEKVSNKELTGMMAFLKRIMNREGIKRKSIVSKKFRVENTDVKVKEVLPSNKSVEQEALDILKDL